MVPLPLPMSPLYIIPLLPMFILRIGLEGQDLDLVGLTITGRPLGRGQGLEEGHGREGGPRMSITTLEITGTMGKEHGMGKEVHIIRMRRGNTPLGLSPSPVHISMRVTMDMRECTVNTVNTEGNMPMRLHPLLQSQVHI